MALEKIQSNIVISLCNIWAQVKYMHVSTYVIHRK